MLNKLIHFAAILLFTTALWLKVDGNVIGIDFGSDSMKVALIQPGKALEIVTNFQSKRKTPTCIAFYKGERYFGSDAVALMGRKPELSFEKVFRMIGRNVNNPFIKEIIDQYHPYNIQKNDSTSLVSINVEDSFYTPEDIIAMILQHVKDMTNNFGGHAIKDCVITVPSYFTQHERDALYTAAHIADLKVLSLVEENTAAALHYSMDNTFDRPTNILYYNMGAGSVQVTIVSYSTQNVKEGSKNKTVGQFEVVGKSWDASLGGFNFDVKLAELLAARFNEVWQKKPSGKDKDLRNFVRPMTRLRIEANKVKEVLSANAEYPVRAEQLHADVDLITKITRADFENACADLFSRISDPIDKALAMANISIDEIHQVELLGGGVRIPKVKKLLEDYFHRNTQQKIVVGQHLNGDEAMALGAAFRAANLSTAFRVRKIGMTDISSFGVAVRLESQEKVAEENWNKYTSVFPHNSPYPSKIKTVAFHYDHDIVCKLEYDDSISLPAGTDKLIAVFNITGISSFAKEYALKSKTSPKVHLSFNLDNSGMVNLVKSEATVELDAEEEIEDAQNSTNADSGSINETNTTSLEQNSTSSKATQKKKSNTVRRQLSVKQLFDQLSPSKWTQNQITESKNRLEELQLADKLRKAREAALNELEGYIYQIKNRILDEEDSLKSISTEQQRQDAIDLANQIEEWLYDEGRNENVEMYKKKQKELETVAESIFHRLKEATARTVAIEKVKKSLETLKANVNAWEEKLPHITSEERETIFGLAKKVDDWIEEKAELQEKHSPFEKPIFESTDVLKQLKPVTIAYDKLLKKPKPSPPVVETNSTKASNDTNTNTTSAENEPITVEVHPEDDSKQEEEKNADEL